LAIEPSGSCDAEALNTTVRLFAALEKTATGGSFTDAGLVFGANDARPTTATIIAIAAAVATNASLVLGLIQSPPLAGVNPRAGIL